VTAAKGPQYMTSGLPSAKHANEPYAVLCLHMSAQASAGAGNRLAVAV
jgi:hypothetical protein